MSKRFQCPECKGHFTPQGFKNHCRLKHGREYDPVDEAPDDDSDDPLDLDDRDDVIDDGTGAPLPKLRDNDEPGFLGWVGGMLD